MVAMGFIWSSCCPVLALTSQCYCPVPALTSQCYCPVPALTSQCRRKILHNNTTTRSYVLHDYKAQCTVLVHVQTCQHITCALWPHHGQHFWSGSGRPGNRRSYAPAHICQPSRVPWTVPGFEVLSRERGKDDEDLRDQSFYDKVLANLIGLRSVSHKCEC